MPKLIELTKAKLGILSDSRDDLIGAIITGIKAELKDFNGIVTTEEDKKNNDEAVLMYIVELASWRYLNVGNPTMPQYLKFWLNNLIIRGSCDGTKKDI